MEGVCAGLFLFPRRRRTAIGCTKTHAAPPILKHSALTVPAATLLRGWDRLMATVMMSPMPQDLPDWLIHCATLAPELSATVKKVPLPIIRATRRSPHTAVCVCEGFRRGGVGD